MKLISTTLLAFLAVTESAKVSPFCNSCMYVVKIYKSDLTRIKHLLPLQPLHKVVVGSHDRIPNDQNYNIIAKQFDDDGSATGKYSDTLPTGDFPPKGRDNKLAHISGNIECMKVEGRKAVVFGEIIRDGGAGYIDEPFFTVVDADSQNATGFWVNDFLCDEEDVDECFNKATQLLYKLWKQFFPDAKSPDDIDFSCDTLIEKGILDHLELDVLIKALDDQWTEILAGRIKVD